jgi:hypothetical protein
MVEIVSSEGFRWTATFVVAIGSLVVAFAAWKTAQRATEVSLAMQEIAARVERREVRPHILIPEDAWSFQIREFSSNGRRSAEIKFSQLRNVGGGPATTLYAVLRVLYPKRMELPVQLKEENGHLHIFGGFDSTFVSFLPQDEITPISYTGHFPWPEVGNDDKTNAPIFLKVEIYFSDVEGRRIQTVYDLVAFPQIWKGSIGLQLTGPRTRVEDGRLIFEGDFQPKSEFDLAGAGIAYVRMESNDWTGKEINTSFWLREDEDQD